MPFIWNDPTFWDRFKAESRYEKYFYITVILFIAGAYFILEEHIPFLHKAVFAFSLALSLYTLAGLIFKLPNSKIPDYYSPSVQTLFRLLFFLISVLIVFYLWIMWIAKYY